MAEIGRLITAMVTPFDQQGQVDYPQAKRLANALLDSGSDGVIVSGTTGESPALTTEEKIRLFAEVKSAVGDRGAVIAGTGNYSTAESIELSREAEAAGVDGLLLVVPYYNKPPQEGLYQHFKSIAGSVHLPCVLYNVPSRTSLNMTDDTTIRLSHVDNIVGVKEAGSDLDQISRIIDGATDGFRVWSGNDNETFPIMALGGYGVVSVASHLVGAQIKQMIGLLLEGDVEGAAAEHRRLEHRIAVDQDEVAVHLAASHPAARQIVGDVEERVEYRPDIEPRPTEPPETGLDRRGPEADDDPDVLDAAGGELSDLPFDQGAVAERQQAFRAVLGQRQQTRALSGTQDQRFHRAQLLHKFEDADIHDPPPIANRFPPPASNRGQCIVFAAMAAKTIHCPRFYNLSPVLQLCQSATSKLSAAAIARSLAVGATAIARSTQRNSGASLW